MDQQQQQLHFNQIKHRELIEVIQNHCIPLPEQLDAIMLQIIELNKHYQIHENKISEIYNIFNPSHINYNSDNYSSLQNITPSTYLQQYFKDQQEPEKTQRSANRDGTESDDKENFFHTTLMVILEKLLSLCKDFNELKTQINCTNSTIVSTRIIEKNKDTDKI
jgi:hypothetical protein